MSQHRKKTVYFTYNDDDDVDDEDNDGSKTPTNKVDKKDRMSLFDVVGRDRELTEMSTSTTMTVLDDRSMPTSPDEIDRQINLDEYGRQINVDEYGRQINSDKNGRQTNVDKNGRKDNVEGNGLQIDVEGNGLQIDVDEYDRPNKVDKKGRQHKADLLESVLSLGEQLRVYSSDFSELRSRLSQVETSLCQSERLNETSLCQPECRLEEISAYQPGCRLEEAFEDSNVKPENGIILKVLITFCKATTAVALNFRRKTNIG
jgi:hypothetical protein